MKGVGTLRPRLLSLTPTHSFAPKTLPARHDDHITPTSGGNRQRALVYTVEDRIDSRASVMDVSSILSSGGQNDSETNCARGQVHQHLTRQTASGSEQPSPERTYSENMHRPFRGAHGAAANSGHFRGSPAKKDQKHVVFQLIDPEDPRIQARLPMRVMISPHDNTDSIITTVKNFYGLYEYGVSFENKDGITIIAAYDNFENDMTVYVRTISQPASTNGESARNSMSPRKPTLDAPFEMRPPQVNGAHSPSKPSARSAGVRSISPQSEIDPRSTSAALGGRPRTHRTKSKDNNVGGDADGYSSGDNAEGSVTSSRRSKTEQVNAEISVNNIVEGGRRKRAFESSELPLFVPPQVPMSASVSSFSPQRRNQGSVASPCAPNPQQTFTYQQPLPSPRSYGSAAQHPHSGASANGYGYGAQQNGQLRGRPNEVNCARARNSSSGILPTPDPTVGSVISDEDVALQLMRLGDPTAFSHGRTSTSTVDDALSGKAEAASSDEEESDAEEEDSSLPAAPSFNDLGPQRKRQRKMQEYSSDVASAEEDDDSHDSTFGNSNGHLRQRKTSKTKGLKPRASTTAKPRNRPGVVGHPKAPMSPSSLPAQSRKGSIASTINFQHQLPGDEEDLSSKPRCQRCRKSKKGCDRQRPCGRCRDAGIGIEGCISEDEGNGRKGRYGRHMGVPIKREAEVFGHEGLAPPPAAPANTYFLAPALPDKVKKRKRL